MENIDAIQINFNPDQVFLLNFCLAFLMFAIALDMKVSDFISLVKQPKLPIVGLISQLLLLPLLTLGLIYVFDPTPSLALGMILIAACPGGNISNYAVHLSKGNTALSVMLTSINTVGAVVITPVTFLFWSSFVPKTAALRQEIAVDPVEMAIVIFTIIVIPLIIGMFLNHKYPTIVRRIDKWIQRLAMLIFISFVIGGVLSNFQNIMDYVGGIFILVFVFNGLAYLVGYFFAKTCQLSEYNARAICMETGIQNSGLALILIFNFFDGLGGMALVAAWWGIWHIISSASLAYFWRNRPIATY